MTEVSFQTRARTIDHLGRGQIADSPTAISELWKNAYDAYATSVSLQIFDGEPEVAAIFDDGCGMDRTDFIERWLVIGTESKIEDLDRAPPDTFGLGPRERQGEKGIGRLSAAFLSPATIVISKKPAKPFAAVMVDWRLFENPFITLEDIRLPVEEFESAEQILALLPHMAEVLLTNLGEPGNERGERLLRGWEKFTQYEIRTETAKSTASQITEAWRSMPLSRRHLEEWPAFLGLEAHGTALFMLGIHHELALWVRPDSDDEEAGVVKDRLRQTLVGFTDPYSESRLLFDYEVLLHRGEHVDCVLRASDVFGYEELKELENYVTGSFDENGVFRGRVVVLGRDIGIKEYVPRRPPPKTGRDRLGRFSFCIGTYERELANTTHTEQQFSVLTSQVDKYGGVSVYRDGLRVMPYGRTDSDAFEIEERRGKHAGRYFWAHRRSFGRVAFTRTENPNLRDKAGREGLVDNRAFRELKILVKGVLVDFAYRYFGSDSDFRKEMLPEIQKANEAAREAAAKAKTRRRRNVRVFLKEQLPELQSTLADVAALSAEADEVKRSRDRGRATVLAARFQNLALKKDDLRPPPAPAKLGELEDKYREYRDGYRELTAGLENLAKATAEIQASVGSIEPQEAAKRSFSSHQSILSAKVENYLKAIEARMDGLRSTWRDNAGEDRGAFYKLCHPLLEDEIDAQSLVRFLNLIEIHRQELEEEFSAKYTPIIRALDQLAEGIDLDSALSVTEDDKSDLEDKIRDLNAVAQVGITVEIVGHELEALDAEVRRNLMRLPEAIRQSSAFKLAFEAHHALTEKLRFLSPLKVAGYRAREKIEGAAIADYVSEFFQRILRDNRISFEATPAFRSLRIVDLPSRIYPVFINLVNNAVYWVTQAVERRIILDLVEGKVIVSDSGRGVDPDDIGRLFELFFTRRAGGRGVGLYLCKANLGIAHHAVRYAGEGDPKVLPGANFVIEFKGLTRDA